MRKWSKTSRTLGEHEIFGDEEAAQLRADLAEVRAAVADLNARLHAQFTTIAAHAEIAREQSEFARSEARADLERTRETLIGLIEQARSDAVAPRHAPGHPPGASQVALADRFDTIEQCIEHLTQSIETCFARQHELADSMAALLDTVLSERRGEPVAGLSLA